MDGSTPPGSGNKQAIKLTISGMTCAGCAGRVERVITKVPGVLDATVNLATEQASVEVTQGVADIQSRLIDVVEKAGFSATPVALQTVSIPPLTLAVSGMTCAGCAGRVERVLKEISGVSDAVVNLATERASVEVNSPDAGLADRLISAIEDAGFTADLIDTDLQLIHSTAIETPNADSYVLARVAFSTILTLPFFVQMGVILTPWHFELTPWWQFALATPVQFIAASRFYRPAWYALKAGSGNMDLLVVLGTLSTWGLSTYLLINADEPVLYFEASAAVITLVLLGKWLESRAKSSSASAIKSLMALRPETARVQRDGNEIEIPISDVRVGDMTVVRPGERIPVDGVIVEGASHVDEALITGESLPVAREAGNPVTGGAVNGEGMLLIETTAVGQDSTLSRIIHLVEEAQAGKAPVQRLVDRISQIFVPVIIAIAVLTFGGWMLAGHTFEGALINAVTVLVIACPCALGLATPTAIMVGTGVAARNGILIRDIKSLERARQVTSVIFDKTGTLTEGRPQVSGLWAANGDEAELLQLCASAQQGSEHPLAKAVLDKAGEAGTSLLAVSSFKSLPGRGLLANVGAYSLLIGSRRLMQEHNINTETLDPYAETSQSEGKTLLWVASENSSGLIGLIALSDTLRTSSPAAVRQLNGAGIKTVMLSGDNRQSAETIAASCGIKTVIADVLPDEKADHVIAMQNSGERVAMVGDGLNDAPALAAADIGIAMGTGTDVAMETAGITLMRANPTLVGDALSISSATYNKIRQNLFWAFIYNIIAIPLAALGHLSPVIAGAAMAMSSVSVVSSSLLLKRWRRRGAKI